MKKIISVIVLAAAAASAQKLPLPAGEIPVYRTSVVAGTVKAVNYRHRGGATKIDLRGTALLPSARAEAKVESKQGYIEIEVEFDNLQPANRQGAEYLTYVLWAITPEGRTSNLGEILLNGTKGKLNVTTELQTFGMVVTAEPYFSVTRPSDLIMMENVVRQDTAGKVEEIDAKYELLQRGQYSRLANPLALKLDRKIPLELYQARNAVQIARAIGAERFASESFMKATQSLAQAEAYQTRKAGKKPVKAIAREAVQTAEDARAIAVTRQEEAALASERRESGERQAQSVTALAAAQSETERVTRDAELARLKAQESSLSQIDRLGRENETRAAAATLAADRVQLDRDTRALADQAEAVRTKAASDARIAAAEGETERLRRENATQRTATLDAAAAERAQMATEKTELRSLLLKQFGAILETRDTSRGLVLNMTDVLFDTGSHTLRPLGREKLAKFAGIVLGHLGLTLEVEGHTDNAGADAYTQRLSEQRGESVRDFLTQEGIAGGTVTARGFGKSHPAASNDTVLGRQENRRVELVVSGNVIGQQLAAAR